MTISSRTPEGTPSHCAVCGAATSLEFSLDTGDAPCPVCGCLLWKSAANFDVLRQWLENHTEAGTGALSGTTQVEEIDSLALIALILELEDAYDITIPVEQAENIGTVGDIVRYILENGLQE